MALARHAATVVAIDLHADALPTDPTVVSLVADMRRFALRRRFDVVLIADFTLQLLDDRGQRRCLRRAAEHVTPGGVVAFEVGDFQADSETDAVDDMPIAEYEGITLVAGLDQDRAARTTHYRRHFHGVGDAGPWHHADELAIRSLDGGEVTTLLEATGLAADRVETDGYRRRVVARPVS